jgi:tetratricopeptide (TPR) repeat protein/polyferredoxin
MSGKTERRLQGAEIPSAEVPAGAPRPRRNYARWRALSLSLVYVVFGAHIIHWKTSGKTLAPLELNEVMYTLELGIITAGFLFMCFLALGTLVFGRFFCSWACHIMVLQDLCAWILRKLGIRQKPIRSRVLLLVPPLTAFYMFLWPQIVRAWHSKGLPTFRVLTDREGWASFVTDNFWRNLPGPTVIILTFLVCGFVIVYLLGSRTFCTYVCPYGAVFALADRCSPARIRVNDKCQQCGTCTAACTCGIRVHEEVRHHGMVVNPACLKDLDCVAACPNGALRYTFSRPAMFKSVRSGGRFGSLPYEFSLAEELLIAAVFIVVLLSFRGLYSRVPFLLSLALGAIIGYLAVLAVRLVVRPDVVLATMRLKAVGRMTLAGRAFGAFMLLLAAFVGHSAFVRYHEFTGLRQTIAFRNAAGTDRADALAAGAFSHLLKADRWGLLRNVRVERGLLAVAGHLQRFDDVETYAQRVLESQPGDIGVTLQLGQGLLQQDRVSEAKQVLHEAIGRWGGDTHNPPPELARAHQALGGLLARRGEFVAAAEHLKTAIVLGGAQAEVYAELGGTLAELGRLDEAIANLREAVRLNPQLGGANYNLGTLLGHLGRFDEAIPCYQQALATEPDDAQLHNNLGYALMQVGRLEQSREHLERAVGIDPDNADAHFNLGSLFAAQQQTDQAIEHYRTAARLDPRYARLLGGAHPDG